MSRCCGGSETLGWQGERIYKHLLQRPWGLPFRSLDTGGGIKNFCMPPPLLGKQRQATGTHAWTLANGTLSVSLSLAC
jgi:hypothetical protein